MSNYTTLYKVFKSFIGSDSRSRDRDRDSDSTSYLADYSRIEEMDNPSNSLLLMQNDSAIYVNLADVQDVEHIFDDVQQA